MSKPTHQPGKGVNWKINLDRVGRTKTGDRKKRVSNRTSGQSQWKSKILEMKKLTTES
ncbi:MAG: hypothetical protein VKK42_11240 [Lyngbya sp.]|nr:hypothetical protein [Lyngbya sp.]